MSQPERQERGQWGTSLLRRTDLGELAEGSTMP